MQIEGTSSSTAATSGIRFGSVSESLSSASESSSEDQLNYIYREAVKLRKALESFEDKFRLRPEGESSVMLKTKADGMADLFEDVAEAFNNLFDDGKIEASSNGDLEEFVSSMRDTLKSAVSDAFDSDSSALKTDFGITFDFSVSARHVINFSSLDRNELIRKLTTDGGPINELFYGRKTKDSDGLFEKISESLDHIETNLKDLLGTTGVFVDTEA